MFIKVGRTLLNSDFVTDIEIDLDDALAERNAALVRVVVSYMCGDANPPHTAVGALGFRGAVGQPAVDIIMQVCPAALEGENLRFIRHSWAFHNLVAHPVLQALSWLGKTKLGLKVHDMTIPRPKRQ